MTDRNAPFDENQTPDDGSTPHSWANLHGGNYRDFFVSRAQTRDRARLLAAEGTESDREPTPQPAEPGHSDPNDHDSAHGVSPQNERVRREELNAALRGPQQTASQAAQVPRPGPASESHFSAQSPDYGFPAPPSPHSTPARPQLAPESPQENRRESRREETRRENGSRPAWLAQERIDASAQAAAPKPPEDTLQGSRDRLTSRWFALKALFETSGASAEPTPEPSPITVRAPVLAVFSLAGGVGKTSLVATLGRALSARGERVLLVDTAAFGLLPFFFGARDQRLGVLRTFSPPAAIGDAPVQMITLDPESLGQENGSQEALTGEIAKYARGISRVIVDLATASGAITRQLLRMSPLVLVPVVPDMNSVASVSSIDAFFERTAGNAGASALPSYVLNQFDFSLPLHLDVREVLLERLGDRLLPFALRRTPAVSEALAEGMTVIDYAPNSTVAEDFASLAGWLKSLSAPATASFRGVRWSER